MKRIFMKWFGVVSKYDYEGASLDVDRLERENIQLRMRVQDLESQVKKMRPIVAVDEGDPAPFDSAKRKLYIAQVAGFHKDILAPKLKHLIRLMREEFEKVNRDTFGYTQQEYDLYLKGAINFGWLLNDWGDHAINEVISYTQEPSEDEIQELKDKLN